MLAYVFWHTSRIDRGDYEDRIAAFQEALASHKPDGFVRAAVFAIEDPLPWTPSGKTVYEDWYFVQDFAALGRLNDEAVTGPRRAPHVQVASAAEWGTGGLYRLIAGRGEIEHARYASWASKPEGVGYQDFLSQIRPELDLWQRQMTLGPAREFCMHSNLAPFSDDGISREVVPLWPLP